jgi:3-vinyl bacteriochlorophyllide hydratase
VIALHTYYLYALLTGAIDTRQQMYVALAAYAIYVVNAIQFVLKLRAARLGAAALDAAALDAGAEASAA